MNQQFADVIMLKMTKLCDWRCCFIGVLPRSYSTVYCGCHRKTSAGTLFL